MKQRLKVTSIFNVWGKQIRGDNQILRVGRKWKWAYKNGMGQRAHFRCLGQQTQKSDRPKWSARKGDAGYVYRMSHI